jgi:hypothetical protein
MVGGQISSGKGELGKTGDQAEVEKEAKLGPEAEALIARMRQRARNLYLTRQLLCTEAVVVSLKHGSASESTK